MQNLARSSHLVPSSGVHEMLQLPAECDGHIWLHRNTGTRFSTHHHDELEVNLMLGGHAVYLVDGQRVQLRRRSVLWLFPAQDHVLIEQSSDLQMWIAVWKPRLVQQWCQAPDYDILRAARPSPEEYAQCCRVLSENLVARLSDLLAGILAHHADTAHFNAGLAYALLSAWALHREGETVVGRAVHPAVEQAARLLRDIAEPPTVPELARQVGLSPSRLIRLFKAQTGASLTDFRQRECLKRFFRAYDENVTMSEAASRAGFGSYAQFHRVFRHHVGQSPRDWKREQEG
jgi:AraC-like DNA-binding protein